MRDYNEYFSIEGHIGKVITHEKFQCLMADGKLWMTTCRMNGIEASKAMDKPLNEFALDERTYGGLIVADTELEATDIAEKRGFGETVDGQLVGIILANNTIINPASLTKDQAN